MSVEPFHTLERIDYPAAPREHASIRAYLLLVFSLLAWFIAPFLGSLIKWGGLPPDFGIFPAQQGLPKADFSLGWFLMFAVDGLIFMAILAFPRIFGFKQAAATARTVSAKAGSARFPLWFWLGGAIMIASWMAMWGQFDWLGPVVYGVFTPLWWGAILTLDGLVYRRTNGSSLLATRPRTVLAVSLASTVGWFFYEYLNYFALRNWYYPVTDVFSKTGYWIAFALAYTTITTVIFEWYLLLNSFDAIARRFRNGWAFRLSRTAQSGVMGLGILLMAACALLPNQFFFAIWAGPIMIQASALSLGGAWTPFTPIAKGNWGPVLLMAVASLLTGIWWEFWNNWSAPSNPHFWQYDVPFVNVLHVFEMPLLGYLGYLPFGVGVWVWWLTMARLTRFPAQITPDAHDA